jgi:hypothetical protein
MIRIIFAVAVVAIAASVILAKLQSHKVCANILTIFMMLVAFLGGCWYIAKTSAYLAPFFAFGTKKTLDENITVVKWHQRIIEFSNGETIHSADLFLFGIIEILGFIIVAGIVYLVVRYCILFITSKISPTIYQHLIDFWPPKTKSEPGGEKKIEAVAGKKWGKSLFRIAFINIVIFLGVYLYFGRTALGTFPQKGYFYVGAHHIQNPVSEAVWLFSLFYSAFSILLFVVSLWLMSIVEKLGKGIVIFLSFVTFCTLLYVVPSFFVSFKAWLTYCT